SGYRYGSWFFKGVPKLDFERLEEIVKIVNIPIVLHGGSGIPDEDVQKSIRLGISKVNYATELRWHFTQACRKVLEDSDIFDPKKYGTAGREAVKEFVKQRIIVCGSAGKA
ncbi:MAG TPA: class II fructose-bisphosphate aldolase, partial [Flexilinea sp.]|nr:class II fructose-bisphosphate aldolase [Flexilinea sp.]